MNIIKGNKKHVQACLSIAKEHRAYFTENAITTMEKDMQCHLFYVAAHSDEIVGFATINKKSKLVAEISWMAIKKECQHQGFGSALLNHIVSDLKSKKIRLLEVKTLSEDVKYLPYKITRRFYKTLGFIHVETLDPYPGWETGNSCAIYLKIL